MSIERPCKYHGYQLVVPLSKDVRCYDGSSSEGRKCILLVNSPINKGNNSKSSRNTFLVKGELNMLCGTFRSPIEFKKSRISKLIKRRWKEEGNKKYTVLFRNSDD